MQGYQVGNNRHWRKFNDGGTNSSILRYVSVRWSGLRAVQDICYHWLVEAKLSPQNLRLGGLELANIV